MKPQIHYSLEEMGLKKTKGRSEILQFLCTQQTPVDVSQIISHLLEKEIEINTVTVYRTLDVFIAKNIVQKVEFLEGKFRYELLNKQDHHHAVCEQCGKIEDVSSCEISSLEKDITSKTGFLVQRHSLEFFGICKTCSNSHN